MKKIKQINKMFQILIGKKLTCLSDVRSSFNPCSQSFDDETSQCDEAEVESKKLRMLRLAAMSTVWTLETSSSRNGVLAGPIRV